MTLFEVLQLVADVCRFLATHGRANRHRHERRPDRVADRDRDIEMNYEIDKLTAV